jgi:hypothetical protein
MIREIEFAADSPLEEAGFELLVPLLDAVSLGRPKLPLVCPCTLIIVKGRSLW